MTIKQELPKAEELEKNVQDIAPMVVADTAYEVCQWRDAPAHSDVRCTEVHIVLMPIPGVAFVLRLKSARALDELVGVLLEQRREVWP